MPLLPWILIGGGILAVIFSTAYRPEVRERRGRRELPRRERLERRRRYEREYPARARRERLPERRVLQRARQLGAQLARLQDDIEEFRGVMGRRVPRGLAAVAGRLDVFGELLERHMDRGDYDAAERDMRRVVHILGPVYNGVRRARPVDREAEDLQNAILDRLNDIGNLVEYDWRIGRFEHR